MKKILHLSLLALSLGGALAQTTTAPIGFNTVTCLPNSDTFCSVPFAQSWDFQGLVSGTPAVAAGTATLTPQSAVTWTADQYATFYYVRMLTGAKAGMYYQITTNASGSVTVDLAGGNFSGVADGDSFAISKFWTLSSLFPPATQTTVVPSTSTLAGGRRTQLLLPNIFIDGVLYANGVNLAPRKTYYIFNSHWLDASGNVNADNVIVPPDQYFIVRHANAAITSSTTFTATGIVELNAVAIPLATQASTQQDNAVAIGRPVPVALKDLDLVSSGAFTPSTNSLAGGRRDQLLIFDNNTAAVNRSSSATYFYNSTTGHWLNASAGNSIADDDVIAPGTAVLIRKYQSGTGTTATWTHTY